MELCSFTEGGSGSGKKWFVGKSEDYLDKQTFLNACLNEFFELEKYKKPSHEIIYKTFVKEFENYGSEESPMEIEKGYKFCAEEEEGAFSVYALPANLLVKNSI